MLGKLWSRQDKAILIAGFLLEYCKIFPSLVGDVNCDAPQVFALDELTKQLTGCTSDRIHRANIASEPSDDASNIYSTAPWLASYRGAAKFRVGKTSSVDAETSIAGLIVNVARGSNGIVRGPRLRPAF